MPQASRVSVLALAGLTLFAATGCPKKEPATSRSPGAAGGVETLETRAAVLRAEDRGLVDEPLTAACASESVEVRVQAARALGRIGGPRALELAADMLTDRAPAVRAEAVLALGLSGNAAVLDRIIALADDDSPVVRTRLALALTRVPGGGRRETVLALMADEDPDVSRQACLAAASLPASREVVTRLAGILDRDSRTLQHAAAYALARMARKTEDTPANALARRILQDRARSKDPVIRLEAARGLRQPRNGSEEGTLKRLASDLERLIRIEAVISLAYPGGPPIQLLDGASSKDYHLVQAALEGMARNGDPAVIKALTDIAVNPGPVPMRVAAIHSLRRVGPALAAQVLPIQLWRSDDPRLRQEAARTAAIFPVPANEPIITGLLHDNIPAVRGAAIRAAGHRSGSLADVLGEALSENHPDIRYALALAAADRIKARRGGLRPEPDQEAEAFRILADLWVRGEDDRQAFPRLAVLQAVEEAEPNPGGEKILEMAAASADYRFRARAARILEERYGEASDPGPASLRPLDDYIEMLRWAGNEWDAVVTVKREGFAPGSFTIRLDTARAPRTSWNFARLAEQGFYDGLSFHRLAPNFIIQGGDPWHDGLGDPGFTLLPEINDGLFHAGAVGMKQGLDIGDGSQFFITLTPQHRLDARNVRFGTVTENLLGVAMLLLPDDRIVSVEIRKAGS